MKRFLTLAAMAALSLGAAACGGDDDDATGPNGGDGNLSSAEVTDALDALSALGLFELGFFSGQPAGYPAGLAAQAETETFDYSEPCPSGGTVRTVGSTTYNGTQTSVSLSSDVRQTYAGCQSVSTSGTVWTFNGNPNLRSVINASANVQTGIATGTGSITGGFRYSSGGKTGTCTANVSMNFTGNGENVSGTITGTMCGQSVNQAF